MYFIGIDPGESGAICILDRHGCSPLVHAMPGDIDSLFKAIMGLPTPCFIEMEKVSGFAGAGRPGSRMFTFGAGYGRLQAFIVAKAKIQTGVRHGEVTPQTWQKSLGIPRRRKHAQTVQAICQRGKRKGQMIDKKIGGETDSEWKGRLRSEAVKLFPSSEFHKDHADAVLIAYYCSVTKAAEAILRGGDA